MNRFTGMLPKTFQKLNEVQADMAVQAKLKHTGNKPIFQSLVKIDFCQKEQKGTMFALSNRLSLIMGTNHFQTNGNK
jgi:hypothetical protein